MDKSLLKKLDKEILRLLKSFEEKDEELEFLDNFISNNSFNTADGIRNLDNKEVLLAFVCSNSNTITFEEMDEFILNNINIIDNSNAHEYEMLFKSLFIIKKTKVLGEKLPDKLKEKLPTVKTFISAIEEKYGIDSDEFLGLIEKDEKAFGEANALLCTIKNAKEELAELEAYMRENNISAKAKYDFSDLMNSYKTIANHYTNKTKKMKRKNSKIKKQISNLQDLKKIYRQELEKEEVTMISKMLNLVENSELKKELIKNIYEHNLFTYKKIEKEHKKMSGDYKNKIKMILDKYKINYDAKEVDKNIELEDLEYELHTLTKYGIEDSKTIIDIVNSTDKTIVNTIDNIFKSGCITLEFIKNNKSIFNKDLKNSDYPKLLKNIKTVKDNEINPKLFSKTPEVLLTENAVFNNNIKILNEYQLKGKLKNTNSYRFLALDDLDIKIDKILELGFENFLKSDLYLLNYAYTSWDKVLIMKEIGEIPTSIEELKSILKDNSLILDSELNEYIYDYEILQSPQIEVEKLYKYNNTKRTYNINGIIISKAKVNRYKTDNNIRISDIVKNSPITEEDYIKLCESLTQGINKFDTVKSNMI